MYDYFITLFVSFNALVTGNHTGEIFFGNFSFFNVCKIHRIKILALIITCYDGINRYYSINYRIIFKIYQKPF